MESPLNGRRGSSPRSSVSSRRKSSVIGEWIPALAEEEPLAAFEVSKTRRLLQVACAVFYCLFAAGPVFGFAALKPVLIREGVYHEACDSAAFEDKPRSCAAQEIRLNLMFTTAAVATNVCALPVGTVLDRWGPRVSGVIGSVFIAVGCALLAFAHAIPGDAYIPGYLFLALGGPFVFISSFQLSNTFPAHSGLILSMLTGAFDASSAIFLIYRIVYTKSRGSFGPQKFFIVYLIVPVFVFIAQILLMPSKSYKTVGEVKKELEDETNDAHDSDEELEDPEEISRVREERRYRRESVMSEVTELLGSKKAENQAKKEEVQRKRSGVWGALHGLSAAKQIKSPWFVLITLFTLVQMTRINFFVATIRTQYDYIFHDYDKAVEINEFFDLALPIGGLISVPFIGLVLDNTSTPFVLGLLVSTATIIGILGVLPYTWAAYANVCLFVLYRPFYYTSVSDYSAKVFGFETFGKVYGLIICISGLFNFSQSGLDALTHEVFQHNPVPVNVLLLSIAFVVGLALVSYVGYKSRTIRRETLEAEAEGATESLMPGALGTS